MALSPIDFAQQLKDRVPIESVVGEYVPTLKRTGSGFKGHCPFHKEKTPSFNVHPDFGFYHCFGCGAHGDVIKFIQEIEKVDFMIALEHLARRAGLEMPQFSGGGKKRDEATERRLDTLRQLCTWAEDFFIEQMRQHPRGKLAYDYLRERGLSDEEIRNYRLGYAPEGYEVLIEAAGKRGYSSEIVAEAGLASRTDRGSFIDRFRDRVIFPITDRMGQTVAFAGRLIESRDDAPKYINSAETPIFHKSQMLYGLAPAREAIRDTGSVILLEGYMDWLALHRHGIQNVLAGMGTSLTEEQSRLIKRMTGKAILLYDGDAAGQKAMFRATELLLRQGVESFAAVLPPEHDPDSLLIAEGSQAVRDLVEQAPRAVDYFIEQVGSQTDLSRPESQAEGVGRIAPLLLAIEEPALREGYMKRAALRLGLQPETLEQTLRRRRRNWRRTPGEGGSEDEVTSEDSMAEPSRTEQNLLYILLRSSSQWDLLQQIKPEWFQHEELKSLFLRLYEIQRDVREGADPPADPFDGCDNVSTREWLSRILLLPVHRFGGEVGDYDASLEEALRLQILKLRKQAARRRKMELSRDLQLILGDNPLGEGQLSAIDQISRESVEEYSRFFDPERS